MRNTSNALEGWSAYAWRRWMHRWPLFFLAAMALSLFVWLNDGPSAIAAWPRVLGYCTALVFWLWIWTRALRHGVWSQRRWAVSLLAGVAFGLSMLLTHENLGFWLLGLTLVPLFFVILPLSAALLGAGLLTTQAGWESRVTRVPIAPPVPIAAYLGTRVAIMTLIGVFVRYVVRQAERRQRLVDELEATRHELASAERLAGTLEERQRIAREVHDTVAQGLSAIVVHLETSEQFLPAQAGAPARAQLERARAIARETLEDTRRLMAALRPELLEHAELPEATARMSAQWSERNGIAAAHTVTGVATPLHPEAEITLFRALQEGLANVRKHANASTVAITLSYMEDVVVLDVRDNGQGLASPVEGFGLLAMRERVEALGGSVQLESESAEGTTLTVALPRFHTAEMPVPSRVPS